MKISRIMKSLEMGFKEFQPKSYLSIYFLWNETFAIKNLTRFLNFQFFISEPKVPYFLKEFQLQISSFAIDELFSTKKLWRFVYFTLFTSSYVLSR